VAVSSPPGRLLKPYPLHPPPRKQRGEPWATRTNRFHKRITTFRVWRCDGAACLAAVTAYLLPLFRCARRLLSWRTSNFASSGTVKHRRRRCRRRGVISKTMRHCDVLRDGVDGATRSNCRRHSRRAQRRRDVCGALDVPYISIERAAVAVASNLFPYHSSPKYVDGIFPPWRAVMVKTCLFAAKKTSEIWGGNAGGRKEKNIVV